MLFTVAGKIKTSFSCYNIYTKILIFRTFQMK